MTIERVPGSFAKQPVMSLLGATLGPVKKGRVEIHMPFREDLCQQHGYLHAGIVTTIADSAGGYAAWTHMPEGSSVLATGFSMDFMRPATGDRFEAIGEVVKPGKTLTFTRMEVFAVRGETRTLVARGTQTCMAVPRDD